MTGKGLANMWSRNSEDFRPALLWRIRLVIGLLMGYQVVVGLTAVPLEREIDELVLVRRMQEKMTEAVKNNTNNLILTVGGGLNDTYASPPWIAYGTDWLAYAHLFIAVFFIGALTDPVRNVWILKAGLITCTLVLPLALICVPVRHTPIGWRLIDCSFGVVGAILLYYCLKLTERLKKAG